jgi:hypothetical protein
MPGRPQLPRGRGRRVLRELRVRREAVVQRREAGYAGLVGLGSQKADGGFCLQVGYARVAPDAAVDVALYIC